MNKCYYRIVWENYPSDKTPLNEQNLNKIDIAVDEMDNRIISLDATKFDKSEAQMLVKYIEYDESTGSFKITHYNGASYTIDTLLEKLAINFDYDYKTQQLIIELSDGEKKYVDLSALLTQYEFLNSDTVMFTVDKDGRVTADIIEGSIEERHLRPDYLADIKLESAKADASASAAAISASNAKNSATEAESWAHGGTGTREDEESDNAMEYARQAKESAVKAEEIISQNVVLQSEKGVAGGVASLDTTGKIPKTQLPDDIGSVTGVKGNKETSYRTGNINITPENVGALPLSGGQMDDGAAIIFSGGHDYSNPAIDFSGKWFDDKVVRAESEDGCTLAISPGILEVHGANRKGYVLADEIDTPEIYYNGDIVHRNNNEEYPILDTNNLQKYIQQMKTPFILPGHTKIGGNVEIWTDNEGGNIRIASPDGTMWEIDALTTDLRIFTYANGVKAGIVINTLGQVRFPEGAWSNLFHGVLYGSVIAAGGVGGRGTQMSANGFHIDLPPEEGYAGGLAWYQGNTGVGCFGYYKQGGYHYVGTDYAAPSGELRAGKIYANDSVYIKFPYSLYVRHIEGADGGNLFLNYNNPNVSVVVGDISSTGTGYGTLNVGSRAQVRTDNEGGNFRLQSPNGMIYEMDAYNDRFRLYGYPDGSTYYTLLKAMIDGRVDFPQGILTNYISGRSTSADKYIIIEPTLNSPVSRIEIGLEIIGVTSVLSVRPQRDALYHLGLASKRWSNIFAATSVISTSDETTKKNITPLDENLTKDFIMGLNPISYIKTDGESGRTHYGLGAQSVERLMEELGMTSMDFAGLIKSPATEDYEVEEEVEVEKLIPNENGKPIPQKVKEMQKVTKQREIPGEYRYGLRYEEFIAPLIKMVQIQQREIDNLREAKDEMEMRLRKIEKMLGV